MPVKGLSRIFQPRFEPARITTTECLEILKAKNGSPNRP